MNILTIGVTPYLLTRNGRIHQSLLDSLVKEHSVESVVWHHDCSYFLANELNEHFFETLSGVKTKIFPFTGQPSELGVFIYDKIKNTLPQIVLSIANSEESIYISAIKKLHPHLFKWICILTNASSIREQDREDLMLSDQIVCLNKTCYDHVKGLGLKVDLIYFGFDNDIYKDLNKVRKGYIFSGKNSQMSNLPCFMKSIQDSESVGYLHTNMFDDGEYDLQFLKRKFPLVKLPQRYVSLRDGPNEGEMLEMYNNFDFVVDCSMTSTSALSMLEAMACGCIPIGPNFGMVGEIINKMEDFAIFIDYQVFMGAKEEEYAIVSVSHLTSIMKELNKKNASWIVEARKCVKKVVFNFSKDFFTQSINKLIEKTVLVEQFISVDSY